MELACPQNDDISGLLAAWSQGDNEAWNRLVPVVYDELRRRTGFMTATGLLLDNTEPAVKEGIIQALQPLGGDLYLEAQNEKHAAVDSEAGIHPCRPPLDWNSVSQMCE